MEIDYQLVVRKGPKLGQIFPLYDIATTIGRDPISDISINDPEVSRQHARLTQTSDSYQIEDLESTNGTFVNGIQVGADPVQLAHGNEIQFGSGVILLFELAPEEDKEAERLETAVSKTQAEDVTPDPMLPPDFDHLAVIDNSIVSEPPTELAEIQDELDEAFSQDIVPPPPPEIPHLTVQSSIGTPPPQVKDENPARRMFAIGAMLIFLMMCCCCGFLLFMYQWGGDWLLEQMGLLP